MSRHTFILGMHSEVKAYHYTSHSDAPCIWGFPSSLRVELCLSLGTRAPKIGFLHCSYLPRPIEVTQGLPAVEHEWFVLSPHWASSRTAHSILLLKYGVDSVQPEMLPAVASQGSGLVLYLFLSTWCPIASQNIRARVVLAIMLNFSSDKDIRPRERLICPAALRKW